VGTQVFQAGRDRLIGEVVREAALCGRHTGRPVLHPEVLRALGAVPRDAFVPAAERDRAWQDQPLPIGYGQTISQPFIVALMTDLLDPDPDDVVLEVGTGSGYQAAVLSLLVRQVYSIEVVPELAVAAAAVLEHLGYGNVEVRAGNGCEGWREHGPYDGILVTAATPFLPPALAAQLKPGGHLVYPRGEPSGDQELVLVERRNDGFLASHSVLSVMFVPLVVGIA
jgi:protein-L-isoaspartate(D-aspartate) O-methyltransferase